MSSDPDQSPYGPSDPYGRPIQPYGPPYGQPYGQPSGPPYGQPYGPYGGQPAVPYGAPAVPYASWGARLGAFLLDSLLVLAIMMVPLVVGLVVIASGTTTTTDPFGQTTSDVDGASAAVGATLIGLGFLLSLVFQIWNFVFRQGRRTQSLGKKWVGIAVVKEATGQPIGAGAGFGRWLMHSYVDTLFGACLPLGFLWPLWDARKRTWGDMAVESIVVRAARA